MSRYDHTPRSGADRANLYDEITDKIIAELEAGRFPWVQPWGKATAQAPLGLPQNASTGRIYSGINILILWGAVVEHGFPGQSWLTFRQALSLGGNVRKGECGTTVVYADRFTPEDEKRRARETGEEPGKIPFLKRFTVFNTAQCEGLPEDIAIVAPPPSPGLIEPQAEALIREDSPWWPLRDGIRARARASQDNPTPASDFAAQLLAAVQRDKRPRLLRLGNGSRALPLLATLLPKALLERVLRKRFGLVQNL